VLLLYLAFSVDLRVAALFGLGSCRPSAFSSQQWGGSYPVAVDFATQSEFLAAVILRFLGEGWSSPCEGAGLFYGVLRGRGFDFSSQGQPD
jgi:hypothetical protein